MGKKRVIKETEEGLIKEKERVEAALKKGIKEKAGRIKIEEGRMYVSSSYNNTIITLTDSKGNVLVTKSAGAIGFKGTKKGTSFAASKVAEAIANNSKKLGIGKINILVKGIGSGRDSAIRSLASQGLDIISIQDITPIPHNGCRPKKPRRV